jgi:cytochrome P450
MTTLQPPRPTTAPVPQAPGGLPLLGHLLQLRRRPLEFLVDQRAAGPVVRFRLGPQPAYLINDPALVRQVLVADAHSFDKGLFWRKLRPLLGDGLANVDSGDLHLQLRRLIQPAFSRRRIEQYVDVMNSCLVAATQNWQAGQVLAVPDQMGALAGELVARSIFASDLGAAAYATLRQHVPAVLAGIIRQTLSPLPLLDKLPTPGNRRLGEGIRQIRQAAMDAIENYRASGKDQGDLLSILINSRDPETGEPMTDERVCDQVLTFALAGKDTISEALDWTFYRLGESPEVADQVAAEVGSVLGGRLAQSADLQRLEYTGRVVQEVLRMYPFWLLMRRAVTDAELGGVRIPANANVVLAPMALQRDPALYHDSLRFDPDRWLPERADEIPRNAYLPFGGGTRQCIGDRFAWTALMLTHTVITARWKLEPLPGHVVSPVVKVGVRPNGMPMRLIPRQVAS